MTLHEIEESISERLEIARQEIESIAAEDGDRKEINERLKTTVDDAIEHVMSLVKIGALVAPFDRSVAQFALI
jgi:hypothetical protein